MPAEAADLCEEGVVGGGDGGGVTLGGGLVEDRGEDRADQRGQVGVGLGGDAADAGAGLRIAWEQRALGVTLLEVFEDDRGFPQGEVAVDQCGDFAPWVEREELGRAVLGAIEAEELQLVGELLVLEREPDLPRVGGAGAVVEGEGHAGRDTPGWRRADRGRQSGCDVFASGGTSPIIRWTRFIEDALPHR